MLFLFAVAPASAATITVTSVNDSGPGSLRAAVAGAAPGDTINFSLPSPSTITLTGGAITINKALTIAGPGAGRLAIDGDGHPRVFVVSGAVVAISGVTIQNGNADLSSGVSGGGIYNGSDGTLTITSSTITGNQSANSGGGIFNSGALTLISDTIRVTPPLVGRRHL